MANHANFQIETGIPDVAAPQALSPHQHYRPIRQRQVPDTTHRRPWLTARTPQGRTPRPMLAGLHRQPPLAARLVDQLGAHQQHPTGAIDPKDRSLGADMSAYLKGRRAGATADIDESFSRLRVRSSDRRAPVPVE